MQHSKRTTLTASSVLLGTAMIALAACGGEAPQKNVQVSGPELFLANCARCHGRSGEGSFMAPDLSRIADHWDVERLANYFRDPEKTIAGDARLQELGRKYAQRMPAFPHVTPDQRARLAEWLLSRQP